MLALAGAVEGEPGQAIEERAVLVPHHHHAVSPAVEAVVERRGIAPDEVGVGVVDEHAVGVADDAVGHEEPAVGDGPAVILAANPGEHPVVVEEGTGLAAGLVDAIETGGVDERLEQVRPEEGLRLFIPTSPSTRRSSRPCP